MSMVEKLSALWKMVTRSAKKEDGKGLLNLNPTLEETDKVAEMNEDIKKAKDLVDKLDKTKFKSQCGTTWELLLEDGSLYKRGDFTACFAATVSSLKACIKEGKSPKTITYFVQDRRMKENLSQEERVEWFLLLKRHGVIRSRVAADKLVNNGISFDITDKTLTPCALYLELALCRYINEEPAVVRSMFILTKAGVPFAQALGYSQAKHGKSGGHMVLPFSAGLYSYNSITTNLNQVLTLNNFIKDRGTMDNREVIANAKVEGYAPFWSFHVKLSEHNKNIKLKNMENFLSGEMVELFQCESSEEMSKKVKESKEKGESIFV